MYIREKKTNTTPVLQLVSGARGHDGKVRQRIVLSLGNLAIPDELRKTIAHEVENRMNGYQWLMALDLEVAGWVDHILKRLEDEDKLPPVEHRELERVPKILIDGVLFDQIGHENGTLLGISKFLKEFKFSPRQINAAKISIFNRLIEPASENELLSWAKTTALNELLGEQIELSGEDRFYRISDILLACRNELEAHLR